MLGSQNNDPLFFNNMLGLFVINLNTLCPNAMPKGSGTPF